MKGGKIWLVGETANETPAPRDFAQLRSLGAFVEGPSRTRLLGLGLVWDESLNLCSPGRWVQHEARANVGRLHNCLKPGDAVVICGSRAASAFGHPFVPGSIHVELPNVISLILPHPSGRSFIWNDPFIVDKVKNTISRIMEEMRRVSE